MLNDYTGDGSVVPASSADLAMQFVQIIKPWLVEMKKEIVEEVKAIVEETVSRKVPEAAKLAGEIINEKLMKELIRPLRGCKQVDTDSAQIRRDFDLKTKKFPCPRCPDRVFKSGTGYIKHWKNHHEGDAQYPETVLPASDDDAMDTRAHSGANG